ncbi:MAG: hypothetical protein ACREDJ_05620 [Methylocella sp.]
MARLVVERDLWRAAFVSRHSGKHPLRTRYEALGGASATIAVLLLA